MICVMNDEFSILITVPIEEVRKNDRINGGKVVKVLRKGQHVELILENASGVYGLIGAKVKIQREARIR